MNKKIYICVFGSTYTRDLAMADSLRGEKYFQIDVIKIRGGKLWRFASTHEIPKSWNRVRRKEIFHLKIDLWTDFFPAHIASSIPLVFPLENKIFLSSPWIRAWPQKANTTATSMLWPLLRSSTPQSPPLTPRGEISGRREKKSFLRWNKMLNWPPSEQIIAMILKPHTHVTLGKTFFYPSSHGYGYNRNRGKGAWRQ